MGTADRADYYVRETALRDRLRRLFAVHRPDDTQMAEIAAVANVAISRVLEGNRVPPHEQDHQYLAAKDYAECASLYAYVAGYARARAEMGAQQQGAD